MPELRGLDGITPACAGKRLFGGLLLGSVQDHPRVCGEKQKLDENKKFRRGSPPRVRGKASLHFAVHGLRRITPACAGKSLDGFLESFFGRDHPRVCGEKKKLSTLESGLPGSPPRVRGKVPRGRLPGGVAGITPACAGKSCRRSRRQPSSRDHPRVCGEKPGGCIIIAAGLGSPPRVRGKGGVEDGANKTVGITPACARKSAAVRLCLLRS